MPPRRSPRRKGRRRRRLQKKVQPLTGAAAFGAAPDGQPVGAKAFGGSEPKTPLKGALLFGNDPKGQPRGSKSFGGSEKESPLKGALLFGNDPTGQPRGSRAFGGSEKKTPLKGALLFGNDPEGKGTGSKSFGMGNARFKLTGAAAFGADQGFKEKLYLDSIGYDFAAVLLQPSDGLAGIKRSPDDHDRRRVVKVLERVLKFEVETAREGLNERSIKWGKIRHDPDKEMDRELAEQLQKAYKIAPGERLGIGHVRKICEESGRMHTFMLRCAWNRQPLRLLIESRGTLLAHAESRFHRKLRYYRFVDLEESILGYADLLGEPEQDGVRIVGADEVICARHALKSAQLGEQMSRFHFELQTPHFSLILKEQPTSASRFRAELENEKGEVVGRMQDSLHDKDVQMRVEVDVTLPRVMVWAFAVQVADAVWRRTLDGFGEGDQEEDEEVEDDEK